MHWQDPFWTAGETFDACWKRERDDPILVVVGAGFDPRSSVAFERILGATDRRVDALLIHLPARATDLDARPLAAANCERIAELVAEAGGTLHRQAEPEYEDPGTLGRLVSHAFHSGGWLDSYAEVVIDISALPRGIFFPLVRGVLERAHKPAEEALRWSGDFHVAVCENPEIDNAILQEGMTAPAALGGFGRSRGRSAKTTIWVPVLGEGMVERVRRLGDELRHDEVCPVLPFPARDPRRGDRLVVEYRQLLFDELRIEPRNMIYAAERNPFDLYRTLARLYERYSHSLSSLGPVAMILSSHSSKLLSLGVLLAAYELELEVQHVSPGSYGLAVDHEQFRGHDELFDLWLTGEPYA